MIRVTLCRDARVCLVGGRPLSNDLNDVTFNGDGRTSRASLQIVTRQVRPLCQSKTYRRFAEIRG